MDIVQLAGELLRVCRERAQELRAALADPRLEDAYLQARHRARDLFARLDDEELDVDDLGAVRERLHWAAEHCGEVLAARAFAEGLDDALGARFAGRFRGRELLLEPGAPCPVRRPRLKEIFDRPNTNPDTASEPLDRLPNLCLAPASLGGVRVKVSWLLEDGLAALGRGTRLAAAVPNAALAELTWRKYAEGGRALFYGVKPRDADRQRARVLALLDEAARREADIVVLPELSVDAALLDAVRAWHAAAPRQPAVLVAGSHHVDGGADNVAVALLRGGAEIRHRKFRPFSYDDGGTERTEHLAATSGEVTIHMSGDWSFTMLVCKDLLELPVVRVLEDLRVRLVLVPACTPKTPIFEQRAAALATNAQAVVVVANLASDGNGEAAVAIFGRPTRERAVIAIGADPSPPSLYVLDTSGDLSTHKILDE